MFHCKSPLVALTFALGLTLPSLAGASIINWTLNGVTFDDGGTTVGIFSTDSTTGNLVSFDLTTTAGSLLSGMVYDSTTAFIEFDNGGGFNLRSIADDSYFQMVFSAFLRTPDTRSIDFGREYPLPSFNPQRFFVTGTVTGVAASVPEPASYALVLSSLGLMGLAGRRVRQVSAA